MTKHVRGMLFADYVRMIRKRKDVVWAERLTVADREFVEQHIGDDEWYPLEVFERLGLAILSTLPPGEEGMQLVRAWGRAMGAQADGTIPNLLVPNDPRESLMRLRVHRNAFFDFDAHELTMVTDQEARLRMSYGLEARAEEAASWQSLGFMETLVMRAGGRGVVGRFTERAWENGSQTILALEWDFNPSLHPTPAVVI